MTTPPTDLARPGALPEVFALARRAAGAYQRPDLERRIDRITAALDDRRTLVVVAGDYKAGKSTLVNLLLRMSVCPVDDDIASAVPLVVEHAPSTTVTILRRPPELGTEDRPAEAVREVVPFESLAALVAPTDGEADPGLVGAEVAVPSPLLAGGLTLADCPGDGGIGSFGRLRSLGQLAGASCLVFVSDATAELNEPELGFLRVAAKVCPLTLVVLSKTDLVPAWRDVYERNQQRLQEAGLDGVEQLAVSAHLRAYALADGDPALDEASGMARLERWLGERVVGQADLLATRAALVSLLLCVDQLEQQFDTERRTLADPAGAARITAELEEQAAQLRALKESASRWQTVLNDGATDLAGRVDLDLRQRLRRVEREAEETIDAEDPADIWDAFEPWLYGRVADELAENFALLRGDAVALARGVAELFRADADVAVARLATIDAAAVLAAVDSDASVELVRFKLGSRAFVALRGGYGGVLMAKFLTGFSHAAEFAPAAAVMGIILGNKAVKDESDRQLNQRRAAARNAMRRYSGDVGLVASAQARDHARAVQRSLRDHFIEQADEFERGVRVALEQARASASEAGEAREQRRRDVDSELERIRSLARLVAEAAVPASAVAGGR
ncbi:MAG: hypothetical protein GEV08_22815 [Acidimicrobiia bacterium]|nr:hypothetical protein [Acidimicrobiia bacterium]